MCRDNGGKKQEKQEQGGLRSHVSYHVKIMGVSLPELDVLVAGGGNAGLCAALSAAEAGARVAVVESAPRAFRGGNSRHTRNLRTVMPEYPPEEFFGDLLRVTEGRTNEDLARLAIESSAGAVEWMRARGVRFQPALEGTRQLGRTNLFFLGGGKALLNAYYKAAEARRVQVFYETEVAGLNFSGGVFESATVISNGRTREIRARAFVAGSGGFEANLDWLRQIWGERAENFLIRGTPYNKGKVLRLLLDAGAEPAGDPAQCHAVAIDARAPKFDGGIVTRLDSIPMGIVVNRNGQRFYDEGEDLWPKRYAIWGRLVAEQPGQIAYSIFDGKVRGRFLPSVFPAIEAATTAELAAKLDVPLESTVAEYNRAVRPGTFDPARLDDCRTHGLAIEKTHWALPLDTPPFSAYPLRPGITFTYLGVKLTREAAVVFAGRTSNVFAAGEIMAGNILGQGYLAGLGMTIGTVFGRIAGREAGRVARGSV